MGYWYSPDVSEVTLPPWEETLALCLLCQGKQPSETVCRAQHRHLTTQLSFLHIACWTSLLLAFWKLGLCEWVQRYRSLKDLLYGRKCMPYVQSLTVWSSLVWSEICMWQLEPREKVFHQLWIGLWLLKNTVLDPRQHPCSLRGSDQQLYLQQLLLFLPMFVFFLNLLFNICGINDLSFPLEWRTLFLHSLKKLWECEQIRSNFLFTCGSGQSSLVFLAFFMFFTSEQWLVIFLWNLCWSSVNMNCWLGKRSGSPPLKKPAVLPVNYEASAVCFSFSQK